MPAAGGDLPARSFESPAASAMSRAVRRLAVQKSPRMKILRIIARLNVGGPARHVVWLTDELSRNGNQTMLIAGSVPDGEEDMEYFAAANGVAPHYIREMSRELSLRDATCIIKIFREIRRFRPDVIHTHTAKAGAVGRIAAMISRLLDVVTLRGRPQPVTVHTFHGHVFNGYYGKLKSKLFILIERFLARFATSAIVVISESQFDEIHRRYAVGRPEQFRIIPLGIDLSPFLSAAKSRDETRRELGLRDTEIAVAFVGRLTQIKNVPMFLQAARRFLSSPDAPKAKFFIIGDGAERRMLEQICRDLGLQDDVQFLGNRDDVARFYAAADIVALTSINEGTPLSIIEAMAASRAVISTLVGGVGDLLGSETQAIGNVSLRERGLAVQPGDVESFAEGLIYLAKDAELRHSLGCKASDFVTRNFGKQRLVSDIEALYRELIG